MQSTTKKHATICKQQPIYSLANRTGTKVTVQFRVQTHTTVLDSTAELSSSFFTNSLRHSSKMTDQEESTARFQPDEKSMSQQNPADGPKLINAHGSPLMRAWWCRDRRSAPACNAPAVRQTAAAMVALVVPADRRVVIIAAVAAHLAQHRLNHLLVDARARLLGDEHE